MSPQASPFLERLIRFLIPFFVSVTADSEAARAEILETLASYGARTRAELLNAVQILAFSLSSLDMLHEAKTTDMSPSLRLRFRSCANTLSRSAQKNEQTLAKRLACDAPDVTVPMAAAIADVADPVVEQTLQEADVRINGLRNRLLGVRAADAPQMSKAASAKPSWGAQMMDSLAETRGTPAQPGSPT
jgi:hypothetical protein